MELLEKQVAQLVQQNQAMEQQVKIYQDRVRLLEQQLAKTV
jgi:hypothetical protein